MCVVLKKQLIKCGHSLPWGADFFSKVTDLFWTRVPHSPVGGGGLWVKNCEKVTGVDFFRCFFVIYAEIVIEKSKVTHHPSKGGGQWFTDFLNLVTD